MATTTYSVLGQVEPAASTPTTLGAAVPSGKMWVISSITVCNTNATAVTYRISVRPAAAVQTTAMYVAYDVALPAKTTDTITVGLTLAATDVVTVWASSTLVAFNMYGSEITP